MQEQIAGGRRRQKDGTTQIFSRRVKCTNCSPRLCGGREIPIDHHLKNRLRRRELAVLQSIGMTGRQLRTMLALEGLLYTAGAALLALVLIVVTAPFVGPALNGLIWFFSYRFTIWPIAVVLPLFGALGILIPVLTCRAAQRYSVVERLRQE